MYNSANLSTQIFDSVIKLLKSKKVLNIYAKKKQSFEGWLTVELIEILLDLGFNNLKPETADYIDIGADDLAIEIKIIRSGWKRFDADIKKLQKSNTDMRIILFLYFPCKLPLPATTNLHLERVTSEYKLEYPVIKQFLFQDSTPGIIGIFNVPNKFCL